jgi:hypothetical protein
MWQKITDVDSSEARTLEAKEPTKRGVVVKPDRIWRCTRCIDLPSERGIITMEAMRDHYDCMWVHRSHPGAYFDIDPT